KLASPGTSAPGTNPEQLFAAGWSACFLSAIFRWLATRPIALKKHADPPAAKRCSGLVPGADVPGDASLTSSRPSDVRDAPSRPPVVWVFAVYKTLSIEVMACSFANDDEAFERILRQFTYKGILTIPSHLTRRRKSPRRIS